MGALAIAGMLSGAGQAAEKGLINLQSAFLQSGLQKERQELENERQRLTFAHDEAMADKRIAADRSLAQERMGNEILQHSIDRQHATDLQQEKIASEKDLAQQRLGSSLVEKGMDINQKAAELEELRGYHHEYVKALQARVSAAGEKKLDPLLKEQVETLRHRGDRAQASADRFVGMADKTLNEELQRQYLESAKLMSEQSADNYRDALRLLGIEEQPKQPQDPSAGLDLGEYRKVGTGKAAPAASGTAPTPKPQRSNVVRDRHQKLREAQAALDEAERSQANPALIDQLKRRVLELEG